MTGIKRILILTSDAGFGHRSAANAIAAALQELYGSSGVFEIVNPLEDRRVPSWLRNTQSDHDKMVREMPRLYKFGYGASDAAVPAAIVESGLIVLLFEVLHDLVRKHQPDAIVTTYPLYQAPLAAVYTVLKHDIPLLTVVTDLMTVHRVWFNDEVDLCLVPTTAARDLALSSGLSADQVRIVGIPVHPRIGHERRSQAELRAMLGWRLDQVTLLAVGSKRVGNMFKVLNALDRSGLPMQLAVVTGGDDALYERLHKMKWHVAIHLYNFVDDMPTLMHAADAIICKAGGLIVTESLASGLPLLLTDISPGQEVGNAAYVVEGGAGDLAKTPAVVVEVVSRWLTADGALLKMRAANSRALGRPDAAYRIAEEAWLAAQRGPTVRETRHRLSLSRLKDLLGRFNISWED